MRAHLVLRPYIVTAVEIDLVQLPAFYGGALYFDGIPTALRGRVAHPHDRALAVLLVDLGQRRFQRRALQTLGDIRSGQSYDLTTLPVAVREMRNLIGQP